VTDREAHPEAGADLCRRASSAPRAAGRTALEDRDSCGRRSRGSAVACIGRPAIVMSKKWQFHEILHSCMRCAKRAMSYPHSEKLPDPTRPYFTIFMSRCNMLVIQLLFGPYRLWLSLFKRQSILFIRGIEISHAHLIHDTEPQPILNI
jgi:hypothetical protein